jgi:hypothetical protein
MARQRLAVSTTEAARERGRKPGRKGKYNARGSHEDGRWFASASELYRYRQLKEMEARGLIQGLKCQPVFPVVIQNVHITRYHADFQYEVLDDLGRIVGERVEDVKGMVTDVYALKKRLVEVLHRLKITEIPARKVGEWIDRVD